MININLGHERLNNMNMKREDERTSIDIGIEHERLHKDVRKEDERILRFLA